MSEAALAATSSRWIVEFGKQVLRGKHVLLYGNIHDQFLWEGNYVTVQEFVQQYFLRRSFDLVLRYDQVDGFTFGAPEMNKRFQDIVRKGILAENPQLGGNLPTEAGGPSGPGAGTAAGSGAADPPAPAANDLLTPPPRSRPGAAGPGGQPAGAPPSRRVDPASAFGQLRHALGQNAASVAATLNLADMLTSDAAHYAEPEREALMQLKKCILGSALIQEGPLAGFRNTLVIVAGELKRVPEWLYLDNPFVSVVNVARPSKEERYCFIQSFREGFYDGAQVPEGERADLAEEFADLTDGFQAWDLEALRRTSWVERIPLGKLRALVDYYKFGLREDPWEELNSDKVAQAQEILGRRVIGQPYAVDAVVRMLTSARVGITMSGGGRSSRPKGVFFFVGPTGVGKTELAKAVTELVFGDERAFARFDMSEYKEEHAAEKLAGAPPGFVGYEEGGQLTNRMLERPHSILLFDEIEKAHPRVLDKFLQILEDGRLTDGKGQTAYFHQAAIIFTSNIGASQLYEQARQQAAAGASMGFDDVAAFFQEQVRDYFANKIQRAEIYNRLGDNIVPFDMLRPQYVAQIGQKFLSLLAGDCVERCNLKLEFDPSLLKLLQARMEQSDNLLLGGRRIKALLETLVEHPLNKWVFEHFVEVNKLAGKTLRLALDAQGALQAALAEPAAAPAPAASAPAPEVAGVG
jgi:hypothetical protein